MKDFYYWLRTNIINNLDIKGLEKWDVSNGHNFSLMFYKCSSLSDIKGFQIILKK